MTEFREYWKADSSFRKMVFIVAAISVLIGAVVGYNSSTLLATAFMPIFTCCLTMIILTILVKAFDGSMKFYTNLIIGVICWLSCLIASTVTLRLHQTLHLI